MTVSLERAKAERQTSPAEIFAVEALLKKFADTPYRDPKDSPFYAFDKTRPANAPTAKQREQARRVEALSEDQVRSNRAAFFGAQQNAKAAPARDPNFDFETAMARAVEKGDVSRIGGPAMRYN